MRGLTTDQPVINVGTRENPSYVPVEVCRVLIGQPANTKLSPSQTAQMIRFAVRDPEKNATSILSRGVHAAGLRSDQNDALVRSRLYWKPRFSRSRFLFTPRLQFGRIPRVAFSRSP